MLSRRKERREEGRSRLFEVLRIERCVVFRVWIGGGR
jgi:hypothetical protein